MSKDISVQVRAVPPKNGTVDTSVLEFFESGVYKGDKIEEVGCSSICNRAYEVAIEKKLGAVGLRNNQSTILRNWYRKM